MREISVRELNLKTSEIVRNVRKRRTSYLITYRGQPVGILALLGNAEPARPESAEDVTAAWDELTRLGQEMARGWPNGKTSADYLTEIRR